ncbi:MAG: aminopeptidase P family protein [Candidatus Magasanikbacteria bacterium]|nr:aminopeptidase P family protein [Candidatus Magasanikbacteria bacterium]
MINNFLKQNKIDALISSHLPTVRFFSGSTLNRSGSGFTGTNGLIIIIKNNHRQGGIPPRGGEKYFVTDSRYTQQAKKQARGFKIVTADRELSKNLGEIMRIEKIKKLGFWANELLFSTWQKYKKIFKNVKLIALKQDSAELRILKNKTEIKFIKRAHEINKIAFRKIKKIIKPGVTEMFVARKLEQAMLRAGAEKIGFDTIVASGLHGALPHGVASTKKLKRGELVTIDFGCDVAGYHSDETVTLCLGKPNKKQKEIWQTVYNAQQAAKKLARPGVSCGELDKAARDYITRAGYGKYFAHALGHGVGLEIHERPTISEKSSDILRPGMVFTIEPGIYIPGWGGVRIEDVYVCQKNGIKPLSGINKVLL